MKKIIQIISIGLFAVLLGACNQGAKNGSIAVLDLNRVANETGYSEKINQDLNQVSEQLKRDLLQIQNKLQDELKASQEKIGSTPTEQQRKDFGQMIANAQNKLKQAQAQASLTMQQKKNEAVNQLRNDIRPVATGIAQSHGMMIVVLKNDSFILDYAKEIDITDEVIAKIKKSTPAKPEIKKEVKQEQKAEKKDEKK